MFKNTFSPPHIVTEYLTDAMIFAGLKVGAFHWDKLPKEVQDGVHDFLAEEYPDAEKCGTAGERFLAKYGGSRSLPRTIELWKRYYVPKCEDEATLGRTALARFRSTISDE